MIVIKKIYLDKEGYSQYLNEIEQIREKIRNNSSNITEYQSDDAYGDGWHDNFAYEQAIKIENMLFHELDIKLKGLENIIVIEKKDNNNNYVDLNCIIDVMFDGEEQLESYIISGNSSSNINNDIPIITLNSPLGRATYKKKKGDFFSYQVDNLLLKGKIINIRKNNKKNKILFT